MSNGRKWQPRSSGDLGGLTVGDSDSHDRGSRLGPSDDSAVHEWDEPNPPDPWADWYLKYGDRHVGSYEASGWDDSSWDRYGSQSQGWLTDEQMRKFQHGSSRAHDCRR